MTNKRTGMACEASPLKGSSFKYCDCIRAGSEAECADIQRLLHRCVVVFALLRQWSWSLNRRPTLRVMTRCLHTQGRRLPAKSAVAGIFPPALKPSWSAVPSIGYILVSFIDTASDYALQPPTAFGPCAGWPRAQEISHWCRPSEPLVSLLLTP